MPSEPRKWEYPEIPNGWACRTCHLSDVLPFDDGASVCRNCHWNYRIASTKFNGLSVELRYWKEDSRVSISFDDGCYDGDCLDVDESSMDGLISLLADAKGAIAEFRAKKAVKDE